MISPFLPLVFHHQPSDLDVKLLYSDIAWVCLPQCISFIGKCSSFRWKVWPYVRNASSGNINTGSLVQNVSEAFLTFVDILGKRDILEFLLKMFPKTIPVCFREVCVAAVFRSNFVYCSLNGDNDGEVIRA